MTIPSTLAVRLMCLQVAVLSVVLAESKPTTSGGCVRRRSTCLASFCAQRRRLRAERGRGPGSCTGPEGHSAWAALLLRGRGPLACGACLGLRVAPRSMRLRLPRLRACWASAHRSGVHELSQLLHWRPQTWVLCQALRTVSGARRTLTHHNGMNTVLLMTGAQAYVHVKLNPDSATCHLAGRNGDSGEQGPCLRSHS